MLDCDSVVGNKVESMNVCSNPFRSSDNSLCFLDFYSQPMMMKMPLQPIVAMVSFSQETKVAHFHDLVSRLIPIHPCWLWMLLFAIFLKYSHTRLCLKPFVSLHAVNRKKRKKNRSLFDICLIFRVVSVGIILTDLQSASAAEHHIHDADIADCCNDPLPP